MADPNSETSQPVESAKEKPIIKHKWRRRLVWGTLVLLVLLLMLAALLPTLASSDAGRGMLLSAVNGKIAGKLQIQDLSLSWLGPCTVQSLVVTDPEGREALKVDRIQWERGLWQAIWSREDLGQLSLDSPDANLYLDQKWTASLQRAFESPKPSPAEAAAPAPAPSAKEPSPAAAKPAAPKFNLALALNKARVRMVRHDGREYVVTDATGAVNVNSLDEILASADVVLGGGGKLSLKAAIRNLAAGGQIDPGNATGEVTLQTTPAIELAPIAGFALDNVKATGNCGVDIKAVAAAGTATVTGTVQLSSVCAASADDPNPAVKPTDLALAIQAVYAQKKLNGAVNLTGGLGNFACTFGYAPSSGPGPSAADILAALMDGKSVSLPEFALDLNGRLDLVGAGRSVPALLQLRKDVTITAGGIDLTGIKVRGGKQLSAEGAVNVELTTSRGGAARAWQPMRASFNLRSDSQGQMRLEQAAFTSSFASMQAAGTLNQLKAGFQANLEGLRNELVDVVDLQDTVMGGSVSGTLQSSTEAGKPGRINFALDLNADKVKYGAAAPATRPAGAASQPAGPEAITGKIVWNGTLDRGADKISLTGTAQVPQLNLSSYGEAFPGDCPTIQHGIDFYTAQQRIVVGSLSVRSKILTLDLRGDIRDLQQDCTLDLKGSYSSSWPEVTALLRRLAPEAAKSMEMVGVSAGDVAITGPANKPKITPGFRQVKGGTALGWKSGSKVYGLTLGDARLEPVFNDAQVRLPLAVIPANGGTCRLSGLVDLQGPQPVLSIDGRLDVLEGVSLNEELGTEILSRAMPLFAGLSKLEGKVSLWVKDVNVPLDAQIKKTGRGSGRLDLSDIRLSPAGEMGVLMELLGMPAGKPYPVRMGAVDFELKDGGLRYDNFTLTIGDSLDLKFHGCVKFDDSVELFVSVPIKASLLEGLGVRGSAAQYAKMLEGVRVEIPIAGSRLHPKLQLAKVDVKPLVDQALKKMGANLLPDLLSPQPRKTSPGGAVESTTTTKHKSGLLDMLEGATSKPAKPKK